MDVSKTLESRPLCLTGLRLTMWLTLETGHINLLLWKPGLAQPSGTAFDLMARLHLFPLTRGVLSI